MNLTQTITRAGTRVRPIHRSDDAEIDLVAARMRMTLIEVLGPEEGMGMYTMDWLRNRVRWHLDPECTDGEVFLAETSEGVIVGHTIVRVDADESGRPIGLFSTTFVEANSRRSGVAKMLLARGEEWLTSRGMQTLVTDTAADNEGLIRLFSGAGYAIVYRSEEKGMVRLARDVGDDPAASAAGDRPPEDGSP